MEGPTYEDAEQMHDRPTLAQWARAEAVKAVMAADPDPWNFADRVNALAELIVTGSLPALADEVRKPCSACGRLTQLSKKSGVAIRHNRPDGGLCPGSGKAPKPE